jgi:hypothetical protein
MRPDCAVQRRRASQQQDASRFTRKPGQWDRPDRTSTPRGDQARPRQRGDGARGRIAREARASRCCVGLQAATRLNRSRDPHSRITGRFGGSRGRRFGFSFGTGVIESGSGGPAPGAATTGKRPQAAMRVRDPSARAAGSGSAWASAHRREACNDSASGCSLLVARRETDVVYGAETCRRVGRCTRSQRYRHGCLCPTAITVGRAPDVVIVTPPSRGRQRRPGSGATAPVSGGDAEVAPVAMIASQRTSDLEDLLLGGEHRTRGAIRGDFVLRARCSARRIG